MDAVEYIVWRLCILLRRVRAALVRILDWLLQVACFAVQLGLPCTLHQLWSLGHGHCAQELQPWFKWMVLDAVLCLLVSIVAKRATRLRPAFEAIGWL